MQPEDFRPDDLFTQIQELADALTAERQARERPAAADRAKSEPLTVVSHELCAPIGAVISMSERLLKSPLDGTQRRYAETLQQSARSLLTVLNEILDLSNLEAKQFELDSAPFDLRDLVKSIGSALQARADEKKLQSGVHIGMNCPRFVKGDAVHLRQIIDGLIDNAVKFTPEGSVHLHVNVGENDGQLTLRFDVTDTGIGLSETEQVRVFQPRLRADRAAASSGLGLSIAQRLVVLMGGEICCESAPAQGSLFWFTIPTVRAMPAAPKDTRALDTLSGHVLVVEDNAPNRMLIGAYLDEFGLTYDMVESGLDALERLAAKTYDLVLMDIKMPELDGVETTKRVRKMQGHAAEVPIVALTAHAMKGDREDYLAAGLDGYISKPIRGRDLFAAIAPYLSPDVGEAPLVAVR
jgi:CheY-like chemotaxis protein/nitrogen-specific signal transduction histidine kinase